MSTFKLEQSETDFRLAVQELATAYGWSWLHIAPGLNERGYWRTPVTGTLGTGFPDLLMVKGHRMIAAELKARSGRLSASQEHVLGLLSKVAYLEVYTWWPDEWDLITEVLSRDEFQAPDSQATAL